MRKNHFYPLIRFTNLLILILFFAGCSKESDDNDNDPTKKGEYTIKITGNESFDYKGEATFFNMVLKEVDPTASGAMASFSFGLEADNSFVINIIREQPKYIQKGKYAYSEDPEDDETFVSSGLFYSPKSKKMYILTNGFVELEKVENTMISGKFNFVMKDSEEKEINISGTFSASGLTSTN